MTDRRDGSDTWDDLSHAAAEATGPVDPQSILVELLAEVRREQRASRREAREDLAATHSDLSTRMYAVEKNLSGLLVNYAEHGVVIGTHVAACHERHKHDTDERRTLAARSSALEAQIDAQAAVLEAQIAVQAAASQSQATRLAVLEQTGVALSNWRKQWIAIAGVTIAALAAGIAFAQFVL